MFKPGLSLSLPLILVLALSACQPTPTPTPASPTSTATHPPTATWTALPSNTPVSSPTAPPSPTPKPSTTPLPSTPTAPASPACFVRSEYLPFAFTPDGRSLLLWSDQGGVQALDLATLQAKQVLKAPAQPMGPAVALSPDGKLLAWVLPDFGIQLVEFPSGQLLQTLTGHTAPVTKLKFTPDGKQLVSASHDTWVRVWDVTMGKQLSAFQPVEPGYAPSDVLGVGVSPDGKQSAALPFDGPLNLWNLESGKEITALGGSGGYDTSDVAYSPDGQYIASDTATGLMLWRISDHARLLSGINSMAFAFSPDGRALAYSDITDNNALILASPDGAQKLKTLENLSSPAWSLLYSPDSSLLVAVDGTEIHLWRVADSTQLAVGKASCP